MAAPRTRKELVNYLWNKDIYVDVHKEGPHYILRFGSWFEQTYIRCINNFSFEEWETKAKSCIATALHNQTT